MELLAKLTNYFNHLLTAIFAVLMFAISPPQKIILPSVKLQPPQVASPSPSIPLPQTRSVPWGTTEKISEGLYRTYVGQDDKMGTPEEILIALSAYRKNHGVGEVRSDEKLCKLANWRAAEQEKMGTLDGHKGLSSYMDDPKHWEELNITAIGENASYGYILSGTHLTEWVFDADEEHRSNQLNPQWNLACAGISGVTVDIIFGKR
jgi:uncharacterized protein YkwD